jgi:hypothetical protein
MASTTQSACVAALSEKFDHISSQNQTYTDKSSTAALHSLLLGLSNGLLFPITSNLLITALSWLDAVAVRPDLISIQPQTVP